MAAAAAAAAPVEPQPAPPQPDQPALDPKVLQGVQLMIFQCQNFMYTVQFKIKSFLDSKIRGI